MLILKLWNYIRGYVIILAESYFPEKFINVCKNRGIFLWDINREKNNVTTFKTGVKGFKKLRPVAKKTGCRIRVVAKKGIPFVFYRYRKRKGFIIGCLIFVAMIYFLSSFVWTVEVYGNKKVPTEKILSNLAILGLKPGVWKVMVDTNRISNEMLIRIDELAWVNIDIPGTRAIVEVVERVMPPKIINKDLPYNIIAAKDGLIISILVKSGIPLVKRGDTVKKGDLLVTGIVENRYSDVRYVHALADIKARTWYEEIITVPLSKTVVKPTGNEACKYSIKIFDKIIGFGDTKPPFKCFDVKQEIKQLFLGKNNPLPFGIIINRYIEKKLYNENISIKQAKQIAVNDAWNKIKSKIPENAKINEKKVFFIPTKDAVKVRMLVECVEEIGIQERIQ